MKEVSTDDCWHFAGYINKDGYGRITWMHRTTKKNYNRQVHRIMYEALVGKIPYGLQIDHLCRVRRCCNPDHLEPVTFEENMRRAVGLYAPRYRPTHCIHGHEFTEENTIHKLIRDRTPGRGCRACAREYHIKYYREVIKPAREAAKVRKLNN